MSDVTLRGDISGRGVSREELREELRGFITRVEFDAKLAAVSSDIRGELRGELHGGLQEVRREVLQVKSDLLQQINEQTKTLYRTIVVSNATMAFAVAGLAFGAARLS